MNEVQEILNNMVDGAGRDFIYLVDKCADKIIFSVISRHTEKWTRLCELLEVDIGLAIEIQLIMVLAKLNQINMIGGQIVK
jgi:hypothetical protein